MPSDVRRIPQQDRARKSVDAILDATGELLEGGDPATVTMSAIGASAGISKAAIYRYYPDRGAVMRALANRYLDELDAYVESELTTIQTAADAAATVDRMIDSFYRVMQARPGLRTMWITGFNSAELGSVTLDAADRLAARFVDTTASLATGSVGHQDNVNAERRCALAIHLCRAAIEIALHSDDAGQQLVDDFKQVAHTMTAVETPRQSSSN